jgi:hypothetical protein
MSSSLMNLLKRGVGAGTTPVSGGDVLGTSGHIKYVELYGTTSSIAAGASAQVINYQPPSGFAAELYAVGVMPDVNIPTGLSNLLSTSIGYDNKLTGINFLTASGWAAGQPGMNALPFGDRGAKQPLRILDFPMQPGNLTVKYKMGSYVQIVCYASSGTAVSQPVRARAKLLLYDAYALSSVYGASLSNFDALPGGVNQALPITLFCDYALLGTATGGNGQWVDLYTKLLGNYEQILLTAVGVAAHDFADSGKLLDLTQKKEFPEYEPYFKINSVYNTLPFGDTTDEQPTQRLPASALTYPFTNTTMKFQIRDTGVAIAVNQIAVQLYGVYKRLM